MFSFFSSFGDIVDLNLDYFPDFIAVTFTKHADALKLLSKEMILYKTAH
jgi:hypothetical protein